MNQTHIETLNWLGRFRLAIQRLRSGELGDFAILKASVFGARTPNDLENKLTKVKGYRPKIDLDSLAQLPNNTFGYAYATWMQRNHLKPFAISPDLSVLADRSTYFVRYAITHDMFHVLTGFNATYPGEIGVLAFAVAQSPTPEQRIGLMLATLWYPILRPQQTKLIFAAKRKGKKMGQQANLLIGKRLEEHFEDDLNELRKRLKIF